ncbi:hypothetical protein APF79_13760 [bacterium BRH_c32]|nr:MAG: hypothetical protein APF79_13760 [bacterium BRH_c32]
MGMMGKMRNLAPWFIILVGGLFVLFMVVSDSRVLEFMGNRTNNVGSVDGEEVTYKEYNDFVERARKNQIQSTGQDLDEQQMDYFRDQVWDALVTQKLIDKKIADFGINVSDDEVRTAIMGPNPPAFLQQQFTDSLGNFNRQAYEQAITDPRNKEIILSVEEQIKQQLIQQKLQTFLFASVNISEAEVIEKFIEQGIKMRAQYAFIDANTIPDSDVKVTDADKKAYYDEHKEEFKILAQRKLKYVMFRRVASKEDTAAVKSNLEGLLAKIKSDTASFKSYVDIYSEQPYSKDTLNFTSLPEEAKDLLQSAAPGSYVGPVASFDGYTIYHMLGKVPSKNEVVKASHILVKSTGNDTEDLAKANRIYDQAVKGQNFATLAKTNSDDPGSAVKGGELGWFGKNQMVKEFENAVYSGAVGSITKPVKTSYGYHVIKIEAKSSQDFVVEKINNKVTISGSTSDQLINDSRDFAYVAKEDGLEARGKSLKYSIIETPPFSEDAQAIAGIGVSRAMVEWAFDNSVGDVSDVYKVPAGYVVATVSEIINPGYKTLEEVTPVITSNLLREKKIAKTLEIAKQARDKVGDTGDLSLVLQVVPTAKIDTTKNEFTTSGLIDGLGREFAFSEYAIDAEINKVSPPIKGNRGALLIKVTYRTKFDNAIYALQKDGIRRELINQKRNRYFTQWVQDLKKEVKIVDNRHLFF